MRVLRVLAAGRYERDVFDVVNIPIFRNDTHFRPLVARLQFHTAPIFARVLIDSGSKSLHFLRERRQRRGVALGQLANAAGECLRNAGQLALHGG